MRDVIAMAGMGRKEVGDWGRIWGSCFTLGVYNGRGRDVENMERVKYGNFRFEFNDLHSGVLKSGMRQV